LSEVTGGLARFTLQLTRHLVGQEPGATLGTGEEKGHMKNARVLTLLCAVLTATPAFAQTIKVNWNQSAQFSSYKTYAWKIGTSQANSFYAGWVKADVDAQLTPKGFTLASANQKPDIYVTFHIQTQELLDATTTDDGFGPGWGWGGGPWGVWGGWGGWEGGGFPDTAITTEQPRTMGILTVDLYDVAQKHLVWRGQATVDSVSNSQKGDESQTEKSVQKMFKNYPPKKK
jgi:Domain of unknown function (DUF4136)